MPESEKAEDVGSRLIFNGDRETVDVMMIEVIFYVYIAFFYKANILRRWSKYSTEILREQKACVTAAGWKFCVASCGL